MFRKRLEMNCLVFHDVGAGRKAKDPLLLSLARGDPGVGAKARGRHYLDDRELTEEASPTTTTTTPHALKDYCHFEPRRKPTVVQRADDIAGSAAHPVRWRISHRRHSAAAFHHFRLPKATSCDASLLNTSKNPLSLHRQFDSSPRLHRLYFIWDLRKHAQPRLRWHITS